jgi:hypothetical protein
MGFPLMGKQEGMLKMMLLLGQFHCSDNKSLFNKQKCICGGN